MDERDPFEEKVGPIEVTFDDVLLIPGHADFLPRDVDVSTRLTREIKLKKPLISAAMDTVTEWEMAVAMAREGCVGVIHKGNTPEQQAEMVARVKRTQSGIIADPVTIGPDASMEQASRLMADKGISGLPVVEYGGHIVGIVTRRDVQFSSTLTATVRERMTKRDQLVSVAPGESQETARALMLEHNVEKVLILDGEKLAGLITMKDLQRDAQFPDQLVDANDRLRVAAAIGAGPDRLERATLLVEGGVDAIVVDSAHGDSADIIATIVELRAAFPDLPIIGGNVATEEGAERLCKAGASAIKVGMGPASICTTQIIAGAGRRQITAILECGRATRKYGVPLIADGGIKYSGDMVKALAAGAESVMIGSLLAGTAEAPGDVVFIQGREYKKYRGMGSVGAMKKGSADRYGQSGVASTKLVPEGIEGVVQMGGSVSKFVFQFVGGLRAGMGYTGCRDIATLHKKARFARHTGAGLRESHPHDIIITEEAPNYRKS